MGHLVFRRILFDKTIHPFYIELGEKHPDSGVCVMLICLVMNGVLVSEIFIYFTVHVKVGVFNCLLLWYYNYKDGVPKSLWAIKGNSVDKDNITHLDMPKIKHY